MGVGGNDIEYAELRGESCGVVETDDPRESVYEGDGWETSKDGALSPNELKGASSWSAGDSVLARNPDSSRVDGIFRPDGSV